MPHGGIGLAFLRYPNTLVGYHGNDITEKKQRREKRYYGA